MQIAPVNNTNFNGRFIKTPALEKIIESADRDVLERFSDIVERAASVQDGAIYKVACYEHTPIQKNYTPYSATYELSKIDKKNNIPKFIANQDIRYFSFDKPAFIQKELSKVLKNFVPVLEHIYPKSSTTPKCEIIEKITKNLI